MGRGLANSTRIQYNHNKHPTDLDEPMNDDYDLDYTYNNHNRAYDLDEIYDMWVQSCTSLDEDVQQEDDYARDTDTYETLAYRHYA